MKTTKEQRMMFACLYITVNKMNVPKRNKRQILFNLMSIYSSSTVVPKKADEVDHYLKNTNALQLLIPPGQTNANYVRFNWSDTDSTAYTNKKLAWDALFAKYNDPLQVNSPIRKQVVQFMEDLQVFCRPFYQKVKTSTSCTQDDADTFHFVLNRAHPQHRTTPLADQCYAMIDNAGTCKLKGKAKTKEDSSRGSILHGATGVEVAYKVIWKLGGPELSGIPRLIPDNTFTYQQFTNSLFMLNFADDESAGVVLVFCRWFIVGKPQFAGPWCEAIQKRIL